MTYWFGLSSICWSGLSEACMMSAKKTGATYQSRSGRSGQGPNGTAPGRRPLRGVAGTASVLNPVNLADHVWPVSLKQKPMLTHRIELSTGLVGPARYSGRVLLGSDRTARRRHAAETASGKS